MKPACMDDAEYALWEAGNQMLTSASERAGRPCRDCPASFALEMRALSRCDGEPGTGMRMIEPSRQEHLRALWRAAAARRRARVAAERVLCGAPMPRARDRCARPVGHRTEHRSRYDMDNAARSKRAAA